MKKIIQVILVIIIPEIIIFSLIGIINPDKVIMPFDNTKIQRVVVDSMPADHSKFAELNKDFTSGKEVTEACLKCHTNRGKEFMHTEHWKWLKQDSLMNGKKVILGKENTPNNFCIGVNSNEHHCSECHAGYGYGDKNFDFTDQTNIDCLACHDNTGTYRKGEDGEPKENLDLGNIARNIGHPKRENCIECHGKGGGGNNVKHGDLETAQISCTRDVDVHMASDGVNMECTECHKTHNHKMTGNVYTLTTSNANRGSCTQCHTEAPHKSKILNQHFQQIACQTCHIPDYAKVNPTKTSWDWSTAGQFDNGEPYKEIDSISPTKFSKYSTGHGTAIMESHLIPEYVWFNGNAKIFTFKDKITETPLVFNKLQGSYDDNIHPQNVNNPSKIYPVKIMRGKQIYDYNYKTLIQPHTVGPKGSGAYWSDFDWDASARTGMEYLGLPYSGKYDFVSTESYWLLNHMVSPKEDALTCESCHSRDSRLANLKGFYLPGRDKNTAIEIGGIVFLILIVLGVAGHSTLRVLSKK
jgi:octaheme c-type cytochrome (tetrathionate reductase family)